MKQDHSDDTPVLITEAQRSYDEEFADRKRRYLLIMSMRLPCLIGAGFCYHIWWLAVGLVVLSIPLPWIAVLIANDGPPRKAERFHRYDRAPGNRIEAGTSHIIDG